MKPPQDGTLTEEERRLFAMLEDRAARAEPSVNQLPALHGTPIWFYSRRVSSVSPWLVLVVGTVLMLTTFARWPAAGIAGVLLEAIGLRVVLARRARPASAASKRSASKLRSRQ
jgi:hypothetical protein